MSSAFTISSATPQRAAITATGVSVSGIG